MSAQQPHTRRTSSLPRKSSIGPATHTCGAAFATDKRPSWKGNLVLGMETGARPARDGGSAPRTDELNQLLPPGVKALVDDSRLSRHVPDGKLDVGVGKPVEIGRPQPGAMLYEHAQRAQRWGHRETERGRETPRGNERKFIRQTTKVGSGKRAGGRLKKV